MKNRFINFLKVYKPLLITFGVVLLVALLLGLTCVGVVTMDTSSKLAYAEEDIVYNYEYQGITYSGYNIYSPFFEDPINDTGYNDIEVDEIYNDLTRNGVDGKFILNGYSALDGYFYYDLLDEMHESYYGYLSNFTVSFSLGLNNIPESVVLQSIQYNIYIYYSNGDVYSGDLYDLSSYDYDNPSYNYLNFQIPRNDVAPNQVQLKVYLYAYWDGFIDEIVDFRFDKIQLVDGDRELPFSNWYTQIKDIGYDEGYDVGYDEGYDVGYDEGYDVGYDTLLNDLTSNFMRYNYNGNPYTLYQSSTYIGSISVSSFVDNGDRNNLTITSNVASGSINEYVVERYFTVPFAGWYNFSAIFEGVGSANFGIFSKFSFHLKNADRSIILGDNDIDSSSYPYDFSIYVDDTFLNSSGSYTVYVTFMIYDYEPSVSGNWNQTWLIKDLTFISVDFPSIREEYYNLGYDDGYAVAEDSLNVEITQLQGQITGLENQLEAQSNSFNQGLTAKYDEGYRSGKAVGYSQGYLDGVDSGGRYTFLNLMGSVVDAPIQAFMGLLNFDVLGVNMSSFVLSLLSLSFIIIIIKICLGGA